MHEMAKGPRARTALLQKGDGIRLPRDIKVTPGSGNPDGERSKHTPPYGLRALAQPVIAALLPDKKRIG
jgi:hypothetical protein